MPSIICDECGNRDDKKIRDLIDAICDMFYRNLDGTIGFGYVDGWDVGERHPIIRELLEEKERREEE